MSDNVESVRTRIEAAFKRYGGKANQANDEARQFLDKLAKELRDIIGASNQAEAEPTIQKLEEVARTYPGLSEKIKEAHQEAISVGQKM